MYISDVLFDHTPCGDSYLNRLPVVRHLADRGRLSFSRDVTFLVGENGTGKSTLLEAIAAAYGFNPEGGTVNFSFSTNNTPSELWRHLTLVKRGRPKDGFFLRAESLYNVATHIEELDKQPACSPPITDSYGGTSLHKQSHGESFLSIVQHRFGGDGLYILDEPEAALSPMKLLTLMAEIHSLTQRRSQFIIATHSPMLMAFPGAEILELSDGGIQTRCYRETEHYQITKQFLNDPDRILRYLLEGSDCDRR